MPLARVTTVRPPLLVETLISTLGQLHGSNPVLVGFVDTALVDEPGLYSLVDADSVESGHEPGKWLQLSGTQPGVPTIPDPSRPAPFGHDQIHPNAINRLEIAAYDAWYANRHGTMTVESLLASLQRTKGGKAGKGGKKKKPAEPSVQPSLEVLCAIFDETFTVGHGEIVNNATRIRFTTDGVAIEHEQPGLVKWLKDKTYGVGRW